MLYGVTKSVVTILKNILLLLHASSLIFFEFFDISNKDYRSLQFAKYELILFLACEVECVQEFTHTNVSSSIPLSFLEVNGNLNFPHF